MFLTSNVVRINCVLNQKGRKNGDKLKGDSCEKFNMSPDTIRVNRMMLKTTQKERRNS